MGARVFVRTRIDEHLRVEAAAVLEEFGLTVSDAVRMLLTRIAKDGAFPLELKIPNAETRAAMAESRRMMQARRRRFANQQELFDALDESAR